MTQKTTARPLVAGTHQARGIVRQFRPAARTNVQGGMNNLPVTSSTSFSYDVELELISLEPRTPGIDRSLAVRVMSTRQNFDLPIGNTVRVQGHLGPDNYLYATYIFDENNNVVRYTPDRPRTWLIVLLVLLVVLVLIPLILLGIFLFVVQFRSTGG